MPFAPETAASGINRTAYLPRCWYRRAVPALSPAGGRIILHFGAIDYRAVVWVNDVLVGSRQGGYTPFSFDITPFMTGKSRPTVVVCVEDDPHDLAKPRGKQDWQLEPHSIWYPRTTGIWQTVWMERVPATWLSAVRWRSSLRDWDFRIETAISGELRDSLRLRVMLTLDGDWCLTTPTA